MADVIVKLNSSGVRKLLKSPEIEAVCQELANAIAMRAGDGYDTDTHTERTRVMASVFPSTDEAKRDNLKNNTLLKATRK